MIDPENGAEQWCTLLLRGKRTPGVVTISGNDLVFGWDIKNASGQGGATTSRTDEPIKKFTATFDLSNEEDGDGVNDMERWDEIQDILEDTAFKDSPEAVEVFHPDLARNHITAAVVAKIGGMALDGKGGGKIAVDFIEFRPPKPKKTGSAKQVKTAGDKKIDEAKKEFQDLLDAGKKPPAVIGDAL